MNELTLSSRTANQALLAIAFLLLCYQLIVLKAEQYHLHKSENSELITSKWLPNFRQRRHFFIHLLSLLLLAAFALAIAHSALLGRRADQDSSVVRRLYFAFVVVMFIFLGSLLLLMIGLPYNDYENDSATGLFLILMVSVVQSAYILSEIRWDNG